MRNSDISPLVIYLEDETTTTGKVSQSTADCIYRARVVPNKESSIVNLCDSDDGLYGMLALPDGVYSVEPLQHDGEEDASGSHRHRQHLVHRVKSQTFHHAFDHTNGTAGAEEDEVRGYDEMAWEDINARKQRSRRSANSWDHYVEIMVVADTEMYRYHHYNLEDYVLTLFSTVASIYRHQSLRASINVVVVKLVILKTENMGPRVSSNAQESLQDFCRWQTLYNDRNDDSINHHDVAILLTRGDICRAPGKCDTLGLAELGTMCDPQKSCAIIEDNGLSAAFTIAHELGHVFNIPHDDERRCGQYMQLNKNNFHIMAPTLEYNTHPWSWSACSSAILERFLDDKRGQIQCLFDQPVQRKYYEGMFDSSAPGRKYDVNQQCKFVFGPQSELCPYMPTCRRLWCATYYGTQMGCRTQHMPWADGTQCDKNGHMFCHRGECVGMAPEHRERLDGNWGEWKPWGQCSRTCGGGVQKALRDCDNPRPSNGGKYCVGQRERYRSCNAQECPWDTPGFREVQCADFNNKDVGIHGIPPKPSWIPKYTGVAENERCKLYCRVHGSAAFYLLKDKVTDGTPCDRNGDDICVDGSCLKAGCDHRLYSTVVRDRCGICGGDGTSCRTVKGTFNEVGSFGYNEVMKIPAGSANIDIRQHGFNNQKEDDNYLSLRAANGEFLLNGQFQVSMFRQMIPIQDVVLEYSGSDNIVERINGTGPIRHDIFVQVLSVGNNPPDISYEYMTAVPGSSITYSTRSNNYWRHGERWSECDRVCQGRQSLEQLCMDATTNRVTDDRNCRVARPAPNTRMCNIECTTKWMTESTSQCSARCGHGERRQRVFCVRVERNGQNTPLRDNDCEAAARPQEVTACFNDCTGRRWKYSDWTACSATCGSSGVLTRKAFCMDDHDRQLDERMCEREAKDVVEKECNRLPCPRWVYGHWSECSRSCDGGVRMRHAQCMDAADREVQAYLCGPKIDREACNEQMCTRWNFGEWSGCSATCGDGVQQRNAICEDRDGNPLADHQCDHRERIVEKPCTRPSCPGWKLGDWSQCSVSCLEGWSTRRVSCVDHRGNDVPQEQCLSVSNERPPSHKLCNQGPCPFWRFGDWTACSSTCGRGTRTRPVDCMYREQIVDNSFCGDAPLPKKEEECSLIACTSWTTTPWTSCTVSCGTGIQTRTVSCVSEGTKKTVENYLCNASLRPREKKECHRDACEAKKVLSKLVPEAEIPRIRWATGPWTECSASCGDGTQRRQVVCRDHARDLPEKYCSHLEPVNATRTCNLKACSYWKTGSWQPCSATCGTHAQQTRSVRCVDMSSGQDINETDCPIDDRPASFKTCKLEACPKGEPPLGRWRTGEWDKCSSSCGGGWRRRRVSCSLDVCDDEKKPKLFEQCNTQQCPPKLNTTWQISPWTSCSAKCGRGVRRRVVACVEIGTNATVASTRCDANKRPLDEHKCRVVHCARWRGEQWGPCSATCGAGVRNREVFCQRGRRTRTNETDCPANQKPPTMARCFLAACPAYKWTTTPWSKCVDSCSTVEKQHRRVLCMNNAGRRAAPRMCADSPPPATTRPCDIGKCRYEWVPTPWNTCSRSCGSGLQMRSVECRVKTETAATKLNEPAVPKEKCASLPMPIDAQECNLNACEADYQWQIGPWEACSKTCGQGVRRRKVRCQTKDGQRASRHLCEAVASRPKRTQACFQRNCLPATCQELRDQHQMTMFDADYTVLLDGFKITVYCHRMNETIPKTFINLDEDNNYSEVYGKRLIYPLTCPYNGERNDSCQCSDDGDANAGKTFFRKVRVDLLNRKININDMTFAVTRHGTPVPFGTAGDCYSMKDCPQGRFSIDLRGTGLRIVDDLQWEDKGHRTTSRIDRTFNNARIEGRCGGFCGKCAPDKYKGLVFEIDPKQRPDKKL